MARRITRLLLPLMLAGALYGCEEGGDMAVTGISPPAGHVEGDQPIEIRGKNFRQDIGYTVYFGNAKAKQVTIRSTELLVVSSPKGSEGPVDVTVRADDGNAFVIKEAFRYENMAGSVVEGMGETPTGKKKGNLAF